MELGWVGMTQVGSEEVRTSQWTPRQRSSGTAGGTSGGSGMVKASLSFNSRRTMRMRGPPKIILKNSQLKGKSHLKVI